MARSGSGNPPERARERRRAGGFDELGRPPRDAACRDVGTRPVDGREDVDDARGAMVRTVRESHLRLTRHTRPTTGGARTGQSQIAGAAFRAWTTVATLVSTVMSASAQPRLAGQQPSSAVGCSG